MAQEVYADLFSLTCPNLDEGIDKADLLGKTVVLLSFRETNCLSLAYLEKLRELAAHYHQYLQLVGLYAPLFPEEKSVERLNEIVDMYQIRFPVFNDDKRLFRNIYGVKEEPAIVVFDQLGRRRSIGTGNIDFNSLHEELKALMNQGLSSKLNRTNNTIVLSKPQVDQKLFSQPTKAAYIEESELIVVSDTGNHRLVIFDKTGKIQNIVGGIDSGDEDGDIDTVQFHSPRGLAVRGDTVFIADSGNHKIKEFNLKTKQVSTLVGTGLLSFHQNVAHRPNRLSLAYPMDISILPNENNLLICNTASRQVLKFDRDKNEVHSFIGNGRNKLKDDIYKMASFVQPSGINTQFPGLIFILDSEASQLRLIDKDHVKSILKKREDQDFPKDRSQILYPEAVSFDGNSGLLITDSEAKSVFIFDVVKKTIRRLEEFDGLIDGPDGICKVSESEFLIVDKYASKVFIYDVKSKEVRELKVSGQERNAEVKAKTPSLPELKKNYKELTEFQPDLSRVELDIIFSEEVRKRISPDTTVELLVFEQHSSNWHLVRKQIFTDPKKPIHIRLKNVASTEHYVLDLNLSNPDASNTGKLQIQQYRYNLKIKTQSSLRELKWTIE